MLLQNHGIIQSGTGLPPIPPIIQRPSNAIYLNDVTKIVYTSAISNLIEDTFTFAGWVYFNEGLGSDNLLFQFPNGSLFSSNQQITNIYANINGNFIFSADFLSPNTWFFVVQRGSTTEGNIRLYSETQFLENKTEPFTWGSDFKSTLQLDFGGTVISGLGSKSGDGSLGAIGLWNKELTNAEADNLWNNGLGASYDNLTQLGLSSGLVDWWDFDLSSISNKLNDSGTISGTPTYIPI